VVLAGGVWLAELYFGRLVAPSSLVFFTMLILWRRHLD
jgi:hypothetical protein